MSLLNDTSSLFESVLLHFTNFIYLVLVELKHGASVGLHLLRSVIVDILNNIVIINVFLIVLVFFWVLLLLKVLDILNLIMSKQCAKVSSFLD